MVHAEAPKHHAFGWLTNVSITRPDDRALDLASFGDSVATV
jgi:hypothetical protein